MRHEHELGRAMGGAGILQPLAFSTFEGLPALELEDFGGVPLDRLLNEGPPPIDAFLALAAAVTRTIAEIHGRGVIHKDLRPANILADPATGEIKIAGLALASKVPRQQTTARPTRLIEGSLPYVSPEQTGRMNRAIDSRSDLYALGVTFYQLLTGQLPFQADDAIGWVHCHLARRPTPPCTLRPEIPAVLSDIILKLLAKVPDDRYQSALGLAHDLEQALRLWRQSGQIPPFPLGERDVSDRFLIPQKLYGRNAERAVLEESFERVVKSGAPELVLVTGSSGIGKSSVVNELHRTIAVRRGLFVSGKFEQYRRDVPYFPLVHAFGELILDILAETTDHIEAWRARLQQALGENGQLVVDLIPATGLIIGEQAPVPELPPGEAEHRLRGVLRAFVGAFATPEHPLVFFLDDLQWADPATLRLLVELVAHAGTQYLLVIGAYRDNEVGPAHPLSRALEEAREQGAAIRALVLGQLPEAHVGELVADTLDCPRSEALPLAHLICEKTRGNPFFVIQFLTAMHGQGLISFDHGARRWSWDLSRIRAQSYSDSVAELIANNMHDLPAETQEALSVVACFGSSADAETLHIVLNRDVDVVLGPAVERDLLVQVEDSYRFPHDRIREAAYALVPEGRRGQLHLHIGRLLLRRLPEATLDEKLFDATTQLNQGTALITSREERDLIAGLNLRAGQKAHKATAYASALTYFVTGADLLGADGWTREYPLAFALELHRAECELLTGTLESAERRLAALAERAKTVIDAAAVAGAQAYLYTTLGQPHRGVESCLAYLRRVGIEWSAHPSDAEVNEELAQMWRRLGSRTIEALIELPPMTDPTWRATVSVLAMSTPSTVYTDQNLTCLVVGRIVNLSLEHGNSDGSSLAYALLGRVLGRFNDYARAFRFGKLGFDLVEKRGALRFKPFVFHCFAHMVNPWGRHFRTSMEILARAREAAQQLGDVQNGSYVHATTVSLMLAIGDPLREVELRAEEALAYTRQVRYGAVSDVITTELRLIRALRGLTSRLSTFDGDDFDEQTFEGHLGGDPITAVCYWIRKLQGRFLAGDHATAVEAAAKAEPLIWAVRSFPEEADYHFFAGLAHAAAHDGAPAPRAAEHLWALRAHHRQLEMWAGNCPENFANRAALVGAELARLRGERERASHLYEKAIRSARDNGLLHNEAIAFETAARFYRQRGFALIAETYLREARDRYLVWGAEGKARELERRHPQLIEPKPPGQAATVALSTEQLDLLAVVKASQTISGVMVRERLLRTLLQLVLEQSGARRALVLLARDGRLDVAAEVAAEEKPTAPAGSLPSSLLTYVQRTHERVLLDDATADAGRFSADPYLGQARARSVLCLPIRRQAEIVALLYLENDLVPGVFTPERLMALELLAAQAAISLENALLLEHERDGRKEAEAAERRAVLLGEATEVMTTSTLDYEEVFAAVTRLCVRAFADWAVIDVVQGDRVVRVAGAHRLPEKEPLLRELSERYPAGTNSPAPATTVLRTGAPLLLPDLGPEEVQAYTVDVRHAELIRQLGTRSAVVVPLVARDLKLGALTLCAAAPQSFAPADVELAIEIGRRAALAIDNSRLLRETQRAVRLRDDFLSVASHELRTPVTALMLGIERLLRLASESQQPAPRPTVGTLERVKHSAERLQRLTDELLDVTRLERGRLELSPEKVDLGALARQVVDDLRFELANAGCPVQLQTDVAVAGLWDPSRLEQVLTNLLSNALKFGPGRPIEIYVRDAGLTAELQVQDHGVGIERERQPFVFDRFSRGASTRHYGGLGLGLHIALRIVQAHGGELRVESEPGQGATFTVTLPWVAPAQPSAEALTP